MFSVSYPAILKPEARRGFHVRFPDLPEALTSGKSLPDTLVEAADCLGEALSGRIVRGDAIPKPSRPGRRHYLIPVPLYLAPKLALYMAMRERGMPNTELARHLKVSETVIRRLLNPKHDSRPDKIQSALRALGKQIVIGVQDAA